VEAWIPVLLLLLPPTQSFQREGRQTRRSTGYGLNVTFASPRLVRIEDGVSWLNVRFIKSRNGER
jgi:hypothetical protein